MFAVTINESMNQNDKSSTDIENECVLESEIESEFLNGQKLNINTVPEIVNNINITAPNNIYSKIGEIVKTNLGIGIDNNISQSSNKITCNIYPDWKFPSP